MPTCPREFSSSLLCVSVLFTMAFDIIGAILFEKNKQQVSRALNVVGSQCYIFSLFAKSQQCISSGVALALQANGRQYNALYHANGLAQFRSRRCTAAQAHIWLPVGIAPAWAAIMLNPCCEAVQRMHCQLHQSQLITIHEASEHYTSIRVGTVRVRPYLEVVTASS